MDRTLYSIAALGTLCVMLTCAAPGQASDLPDVSLTPGVVRPELTLEQICATSWGKDKRLVSEAMKRQVEKEYASTVCPSGKAEIDHLLSRELGGADDVRNLWKQCYEAPVAGKKPSEVAAFGAHKKDRLEDDFGKRICLPSSDPNYLQLDVARDKLKTNWVAAYIERYGDPRVSK